MRVSGAGHLAIILWVIIGGSLFRSDRDVLPAATSVTLVSEAAFEGRDATRPDVITEAPEAPQPLPTPEPPVPEPSAARPEESPPAPPVPEPVPQPEPEAPVSAPEAPPPPPPPADRVAPVPVPPPVEDVQVAEETQEEVTPDGAGTDAAEPQEATAPEEATTRIITEATETDPESASQDVALAPDATPRPRARPSRPEPVEAAAAPPPPPEPNPEVEPETDPIADAVADAVAEAAEPVRSADPTLPIGPPMTASEREGLRVAVQQCWNIGSLSSEALRTTVTLKVEMEQDGRPVVSSIRMIDAVGGSDAAAQQAFEAARRAIIRCGARGFDLPVEKYGQWRDIEMTFNPERMRIR
ncbi:MAG: energy transducer TonB [Pseudomonadota bacterium]